MVNLWKEPARVPLVLDSWAVLAYLRGESGGEEIRIILDSIGSGLQKICMSQVNLGEVIYILSREDSSFDEEIFLASMDAIGIDFVDADRDSTIAAARLKAVYPISFADCFAAGLARLVGGELVTGDPEFRLLGDEVRIRWVGGRE